MTILLKIVPDFYHCRLYKCYENFYQNLFWAALKTSIIVLSVVLQFVSHASKPHQCNRHMHGGDGGGGGGGGGLGTSPFLQWCSKCIFCLCVCVCRVVLLCFVSEATVGLVSRVYNILHRSRLIHYYIHVKVVLWQLTKSKEHPVCAPCKCTK